MMNAGESWANNLNISPINKEQSGLQNVSAQRKDRRFVQYEFYEKPSPLK
jgi:hypothetical protein